VIGNSTHLFTGRNVQLLTPISATISQFWGRSRYIPLAAFKLCLNTTFLVKLLGGNSVVSGYASALMLIPFTRILSKRYSVLQSGTPELHNKTTNIITEAIQGLRQIRFMSLEKMWEQRIVRTHVTQLKHTWKTDMTMIWLETFVNLTPVLLSSVSLSVYVYRVGNLTPSVAFASLGLFADIHSTLVLLPSVFSDVSASWIIYKRLEQYLDGPERDDKRDIADDISVKNATLSWPRNVTAANEEEIFQLENVNLSFPAGQLSLITGKTGSGKSLLINSILGEAVIGNGSITIPKPSTVENNNETTNVWISPGTTAIVTQPPWIENCTVKENILFGLPLDSKRYQQVLIACALDKDCNSLPAGDDTNAGANGATLSGGQRWRVSLARALYSHAEILLLDDILSAVDTHVARWLVDHALGGELVSGRTLILATHQPEFCRSIASYMVQLGDGIVKSAEVLQPQTSVVFQDRDNQVRDLDDQDPQHESCHSVSKEDNSVKKTTRDLPKGQSKAPVAQSVWSRCRSYFIASGGRSTWTGSLLIIIASQFVATSRYWWLKRYTEVNSGTESTTIGSTHARSFISGYVIFSLASCALLTMYSYSIIVTRMEASRTLFAELTHSVLRAPLLWIDKVPKGELLNKYGYDLDVVDCYVSVGIHGIVDGALQLLIIVSIR
jgi:ABC-type multidrug transport system fused ATPase/permease subunit